GELEQIRSFLQEFPTDLGDQWRQQTAILRRLLPANLPFLKPNLKHVLIVPDGWLSFTPFELVPLTPDLLFIERFDVSYLPSASLLRRETERNHLRYPWEWELAAFGDPVVGDRDEPSRSPGARSMLPYSGEEIRSITEVSKGKAATHEQQDDRKEVFLAGQ